MKREIRTLLFVIPVTGLLATFAYLGVGRAAALSQDRSAGLSVGNAGASLLGNRTLSVAFPILNTGNTTVRNVRATALRISGAKLVLPAKLPIDLGDIVADSDGTVFASFIGSFAPGRSYTMTVNGTYSIEAGQRSFSLSGTLKVPPASPGSGRTGGSSSPASKVSGGRYPHHDPAMGDEMNEDHARKVPNGPRKSTPQTAPETGTTPAPKGDPPGINFGTNASLGINGNTTNEPSGGVGGGVVFVTANSFAAFSKNNGGSFTKLDPTTIFPNGADGGFCCDQVVLYITSIDRFVWLMQFGKATDSKGNVRNRYRLAAASPATIKSSSGTNWTYWDFTTGQLGITNGWIDYPDLAAGDNYLYLDYDQVGTGRAVIRMPLGEIKAGSTIHWRYTDPSKGGVAYGAHLTQDTGDEAFWAGPNNNTSMRIFSWAESSTSYFWRDVNVGTWSNGTISSSSPDSQDWLNKLNGFPGNAPTGSARVRNVNSKRVNQIWFAWTASKGNGFRQAQVQWVAFDRNNNYNLVKQSQVWNSAYAFAYPALAVNSKDEVGMSLEYGGPSDYENHVVGFWGDYIVYITTSTDVGITRYGDYVSIRKDAKNTANFDAFGYGLNKSGTSKKTDTHYVAFGR